MLGPKQDLVGGGIGRGVKGIQWGELADVPVVQTGESSLMVRQETSLRARKGDLNLRNRQLKDKSEKRALHDSALFQCFLPELNE